MTPILLALPLVTPSFRAGVSRDLEITEITDRVSKNALLPRNPDKRQLAAAFYSLVVGPARDAGLEEAGPVGQELDAVVHGDAGHETSPVT